MMKEKLKLAASTHVKLLVDKLARGDIGQGLEEARLYFAETQSPGAEKAIVEALNHLYTHLAVGPVHAFISQAARALSSEHSQLMLDAMTPRIEKTRQWQKSLGGLAHERMSRDLRSTVRARRLKEAAGLIRAIAMAAGGDKSHAVGSLAATLGTLDHDQDKVDTLLKSVHNSPEQYGLTAALAEKLESMRDQAYSRIRSSGFEGRERVFAQLRSQIIVDLRSVLPITSAIGEPTQEEQERFFEELHAMFRVAALENRYDILIDASDILIEITPRDARDVGPAVKGEERLFLSMNPRQKLCAARSMRQLGDIPRIRSLYLKFAAQPAARNITVPIVEIMGGMGSVEFFDFIFSAYRDKNLSDPRFSCIDALGRLEQESATDILLERFYKLVRSKPFDPPKRREAEAISLSLGRIARSKNVSTERRNEIAAETIEALSNSDMRMNMCAANDFFSMRADELNQELIDWASQSIVQGLWGQDMRAEFDRENQDSSSALGFRQGIVDLAIRIGPRLLKSFIAAVEPLTGRFCGAFLAVAEILEKIGDETALPLLKKMAFDAWMASDEKKTKYAEEMIYDPAEQAMTTLTRDTVIYSLLYAVYKCCGRPGIEYLVDTARQARSKQLEIPGNKTGQFLMKCLAEHSQEVDAGRAEDPAPDSAENGDNPMAEASEKELLDTLSSWYFSSNKKRIKKVLAIQEIARRRFVGGIEALVEQFDDKDVMVRSAAMTALAEFGCAGQQEAVLRRLAEVLIGHLGDKSEEIRSASRELIERLGPERPPFKTIILREFEIAGIGAQKSELSKIIRTAGLFGKKEDSAVAPEDILTVEDDPSAKIPEHISAMEAKRQYFQARKDWIAGGKKGAAPTPPE